MKKALNSTGKNIKKGTRNISSLGRRNQRGTINKLFLIHYQRFIQIQRQLLQDIGVISILKIQDTNKDTRV